MSNNNVSILTKLNINTMNRTLQRINMNITKLEKHIPIRPSSPTPYSYENENR